MLGKRLQARPLSVVDAFPGRPMVPEGAICHLIAHADAAQFDDAVFAGMYADRGRPSYPPSLMVQVLLLAFDDHASDQEAEQRCRHDLRWKYALGLRRDEDGPDATTLCRFRARLIANGQAGAAFVRILRWAREQRVLGRELDEVVDSTAVFGAGPVQDTFTLIRKARRKSARGLLGPPQHGEWAQGVLGQADDKPDIPWEDAAARRQALNDVAAGPGTAADGPGAGCGARPRRWRAAAAGCRSGSGLLGYPPMRHGHKTSSGRFDGHKAEIGMDRATERITHVGNQPGNSADGAQLAEKITAVEQAADLRIQRVTGDAAYGHPAVRQALQQRGTEVLAPVTAPHNRGLFTKDEYRIDLGASTCACPAGQRGQPIFHRDGQLAGFRFAPKTCAACPLRARCTTSRRQGRTVAVRRDEAEYPALRAEQQTEAWKAEYRVRARIEHKISELKAAACSGPGTWDGSRRSCGCCARRRSSTSSAWQCSAGACP